MNVLVDTNVLLSAALRDRLPESVVLYVATTPDIRWIVTTEIMHEYNAVLARPKFALSQELLQNWAELIAMRTALVPSPTGYAPLPRDPKDAMFLAAALSASADYLITGDKDLLDFHNPIGTRIVSVAEFAAEHQV
jgi:putative PIN family toxin of toxin-antitoxin system